MVHFLLKLQNHASSNKWHTTVIQVCGFFCAPGQCVWPSTCFVLVKYLTLSHWWHKYISLQLYSRYRDTYSVWSHECCQSAICTSLLLRQILESMKAMWSDRSPIMTWVKALGLYPYDHGICLQYLNSFTRTNIPWNKINVSLQNIIYVNSRFLRISARTQQIRRKIVVL